MHGFEAEEVTNRDTGLEMIAYCKWEIMRTGIRIETGGMEIKKHFGTDIKKKIWANLIYLVREEEDQQIPPEPLTTVEMVKL